MYIYFVRKGYNISFFILYMVINMYITNKLIDFLNNSSFLSNSTIILTDLKKVVFVSSSSTTNYLNKDLSCDLINILNLYISDMYFSDYINASMDTIVPIVSNDSCTYMSQIILPIVKNEVVERLFIFASEKRKYLLSNLRFAKTTKHFVELISAK